ncbi:MAG TPA: hypothetical protein VI299_07610 [Polyangiales bacterium]
MNKRIVIIGAGLCGSVLAARLRNQFAVTVIEPGVKKRPLFDDVDCSEGELNSSINRAEGLGGTTAYWHNALIELDDKDLAKAGIEPQAFAPYYERAWSLFLSEEEQDACWRARDANRAFVERGGFRLAHMVLPQTRHNVWQLAHHRYPGNETRVIHDRVQRIARGRVELASGQSIETDYVIACAGGLATPVLLARSLGMPDVLCAGYHDHPMAYVAKIKLRSESLLKAVSCTALPTAEVRAGFVYESAGLKTAIYLRPAIDLGLGSITGPARYILSDLRNDPFSPRKMVRLLGNLDAVREAVLFKTRQGFRGDYFSLLVLGEQNQLPSRGVQVSPAKRPSLNWHVTPEERQAYTAAVYAFFAEHAAEIVQQHILPTDQWDFRNAAHHSGTASQFLGGRGDLASFAVRDLDHTFVCDGSLLRAAGIANTGLTLVALAHRLADGLSARA